MTFSIDMPCGLVSTQNNKEENTIRFTYNMLSIWADLLGLQLKTNLWERNVMFFSGAWTFQFPISLVVSRFLLFTHIHP